MRFRLLSLVIVLCAMPVISPAGEKADNPLKKAKIGDYAVYKHTLSVNGKDTETSIKHTVAAKDEKEVTIQNAVTLGGITTPQKDKKIDLTKPYDPTAAVSARLNRSEEHTS